MSDTSRGPDWWQASDGRWYPGHLHPSRQTSFGQLPPTAWQPWNHQTASTEQVAFSRKVVIVYFAILLACAAAVGTIFAVQTSSANAALKTGAIRVPNGPPLTAGMTREVVQSIWPTFTTDAGEDYLPGLLTVSTPSVAEVMKAQFACGCQPWPASYSSLEVTAPLELAYPLEFLAEIDQPNNPTGAEIQLAIFEKEGPATRWLITYISGYGGDDPVLVEPSLFDAVPAVDLPPTQDFEQLAAMFKSLRQTGLPPSGNAWDSTIENPGHQPSDFANGLISSLQTDDAFDMVTSASYGVTSLSPSFSVAGGDIECATITSLLSFRPVRGTEIQQPSTDGAFGQLVPPGEYSSVTEQGSMNVCLLQQGRITSVQGLLGGDYNADEVPIP